MGAARRFSSLVLAPAAGLAAALLVAACFEPATAGTIAPKDAVFALSCSPSCGPEGRDHGIAIEVGFLSVVRQLPVCCADVAALAARLQTVQDFWCDGLDVPEQTIGALTVGTTASEVTGKRGGTLDQGEGYVAFNCDDWLPKLIAALKKSSCCGEAAPPGRATAAPRS